MKKLNNLLIFFTFLSTFLLCSNRLAATVCGIDTVRFTMEKATGYGSIGINNFSSATALAQYYTAPQAITVYGFDFYGIGASTKGNVLLQAAGIDQGLILAVGEVNSRKFGKQTPGSSIPIVPEASVLTSPYENKLLLVLPWHFRENLLPKLEDFLGGGGKLLFPLPRIEIVSF